MLIDIPFKMTSYLPSIYMSKEVAISKGFGNGNIFQGYTINLDFDVITSECRYKDGYMVCRYHLYTDKQGLNKQGQQYAKSTRYQWFTLDKDEAYQVRDEAIKKILGEMKELKQKLKIKLKS